MRNISKAAAAFGFYLGLLTSAAPIAAPDLGGLKFRAVEIITERRETFKWNSGLSRFFIMASFTSESDLRDYARAHDYTIWGKAYTCLRQGIDVSQELQAIPVLSDTAGAIEPYSGTQPGRDKIGPDNFYRLYIGLKSIDFNSIDIDGSPIYQYDLQRDPRDICFRLSGGNERGETYVSNTVVIPKEALIDALSSASLR